MPFEDFAVAKGEIELGDLVNLAFKALKEPPGKTAFTLEATLNLIGKWNDGLAHDLKPENHVMAHKLKEIGRVRNYHENETVLMTIQKCAYSLYPA